MATHNFAQQSAAGTHRFDLNGLQLRGIGTSGLCQCLPEPVHRYVMWACGYGRMGSHYGLHRPHHLLLKRTTRQKLLRFQIVDGGERAGQKCVSELAAPLS